MKGEYNILRGIDDLKFLFHVCEKLLKKCAKPCAKRPFFAAFAV
jgi:hypothetical protein